MINDFNFNRKRKEPNEIKIDTSLIKDNFSYENLLTPNCNVEAVMGSIIEDYLSKTSNQEIIEIGGVDHALFRDLYEDPESEDPKIMFVKIIPKLSILKKMDIIEDINTWSVQYPQVIVEAIDNLYGKMDIENDSFPIKYLSIFDNGILKINGPGRKDYIQYRFDEETRRVEMITYQYDVDYKKFFATFTISLTYNFLNSSANDIKNSAIGSFFSLQDSTASKTSKYIHYVSSSDILKYGNNFDAMVTEDDTILVSEYYYNMMKECTSVMMKPNRKNIPGNNKKIIDSRMERLSNFSVRYTLMNDICYYIIAFLYYTMLVKYKIENKSKIEVEKKRNQRKNCL